MSTDAINNSENSDFELPKVKSLPDFTTWLNTEQFANDSFENDKNSSNDCESTNEPQILNPPSITESSSTDSFATNKSEQQQYQPNNLLGSEPFYGYIDNTEPFPVPTDFSMQRPMFSYDFIRISPENTSSILSEHKPEDFMDESLSSPGEMMPPSFSSATPLEYNKPTPKKRGRKKGKKAASKPAKFVKEPHVIIKDEIGDNVLVCKQVHDKESLSSTTRYNLFVCKDLRLGKGRRKPIEKHISFDNEVPTKKGNIRSTYKHKQEVLGFHVVVKPEWDLNKDRYPPGHKIWIWAGAECVEESSSVTPAADNTPSLTVGTKRPREIEAITPNKCRKLGDHSIIHPITDNIKHITVSETRDFYCAQALLGADIDQVWENLADFSILSNVWPGTCTHCNISKPSTSFCPLGLERTVNFKSIEGLPAGKATHRLMAMSQLDHSLSFQITYHNNFPQLLGTNISVKLRQKDQHNIVAEIGSDNLGAVKLLEPRILSALKDMSSRWPPVESA